VDLLETRAVPTSFSMLSPTSPGPLSSSLTPVGGIVVDLFGASGGRLEAELGPSELYSGAVDAGNPVVLGSKSGFSQVALNTLGGALTSIAVRVTMYGGGTGPGDLGRNQDVLLINGASLGGFSSVVTQQTSPDGQTGLSMNLEGGFRSGSLDTGFFSSTDPGLLSKIYTSIAGTGQVGLAWQSTAATGRSLDFLAGLSTDIQAASGFPILAFNPPIITDVKVGSPIDEGSTATIDVTAFNLHRPGSGDVLTYQFDPNNDGTFPISNTTGSTSIAFDRPGTYVVPIRVYNLQGARADSQAVVVVRNVAPIVTASGEQSAVMGTSTAFQLGSFADPGQDDPWIVYIDWGDGSAVQTIRVDQAGDLGSLPHTYSRAGTYDAAVTVADLDGFGLSGAASFRVVVQGVAPSLASPGDQQAIEGNPTPIALGDILDVLQNGPWTVQVDWGDDSAAESFATARSGMLDARVHTFPKAGKFSVSVHATSAFGPSDSVAFVVDVANVAPSLTSPGAQATLEGSSATLALGSFTDPGADSPWTIRVAWSDGSDEQTTTVGRPGDLGSATRVFGVHGVYQATVEVTDAYGLRGTSTFYVVVGDVAPEFEVVRFPASLVAGELGEMAATFHDPGFLDRFYVMVDWGDRTSTDFGDGLTARDYRASHRFAATGTYEVVVTVVDLAGESARARLSVSVGVAPTVVPPPTPPTPAPTPAAHAQAQPISQPIANGPITAIDFFGSTPKGQSTSPASPPKGSIPAFLGVPGQGLAGLRPFAKLALGSGAGNGGRSLEEILAVLLTPSKAVTQAAATARGSLILAGDDLRGLVPTAGPKPVDLALAGLAEPDATSSPVPGVRNRHRGKAARVMILVVAWTVSLRNQRGSSYSRRSGRFGTQKARPAARPT